MFRYVDVCQPLPVRDDVKLYDTVNKSDWTEGKQVYHIIVGGSSNLKVTSSDFIFGKYNLFYPESALQIFRRLFTDKLLVSLCIELSTIEITRICFSSK